LASHRFLAFQRKPNASKMPFLSAVNLPVLFSCIGLSPSASYSGRRRAKRMVWACILPVSKPLFLVALEAHGGPIQPCLRLLLYPPSHKKPTFNSN